MQIKDLFVKQIDRELQGVIIVGQDEKANVVQELEEYVVTRELQKHFADFFTSYKKGIVGTTTKTGVWISGFFGSGKSHFLKILSYLLANKKVGGKMAIDYFIDDNKIEDPMVLADMKLAADTPTDVVLFNIDSKSNTNGKRNKDTIVSVFLKVFNEMQGFCGAIPHVADLERKLTEEGKYETFKEAFSEEYGDEWENSRQDFDFIQDTVVDVLVSMGFMTEAAARNWCEKATGPYSISIEDFAKRVKAYLQKKEKNSHIVFLADEVGQYIGDDSNLMLDLQTVCEELGKECQGRAWLIVTSQQDIDSITHVKGNDFSKIQGRFDTRLSLSSANVDAVIKKRILEKTPTAEETLALLYEQKQTVIRNLIVFNDGIEKKLYAGMQDFTQVYPFVPYQFNLLASVLTSIRTHGASGKHLSEGERSMLALFKESAVAIKEQEVGSFVPFYLFYNPIVNFLDHSHSSVVARAYENSYINPDHAQDVFAVNVLKTLFMIKYVREIEANVENITSLMIESIDDDRLALKSRVEEALKVLMRQMLVQKNGSVYIFLTNEEQEINNEIEKESVEMAEVITKISEMIYEDILSEKRYRYPAFNGRYSFPFNEAVDDRLYKSTQNYDIGVRIITPWYENGNDEGRLRMMSGQGKEVIVSLPNDDEFLTEMRAYLKIDRFLRRNTSMQIAKYSSIREAKNLEMRERNTNVKLYLTEALKSAKVYVNGDLVSISAKDVAHKIMEALGKLVQTVYHKLDYIDAPMGEVEIHKALRADGQGAIGLNDLKESNAHALEDVLAFIAMNTRNHMKVSMKALKDRFMRAPYGFVDQDVEWLVARLFARGDIALTVSGESVSLNNKSQEELFNFITKKQYVERLLMEQRKRVSDREKKAVRGVMKELFGVASLVDDEDVIMRNFCASAKDMIGAIEKLEGNYRECAYPGREVLSRGKALLRDSLQPLSTAEFFAEVTKKQDDYLDFAEDFELVKTFFGGGQREIFKRAVDMLAIYDDSKTYIVDQELEEVVAKMRDIVRQDKPYANIPRLPELREKFTDIYNEILDKEAGPVLRSIESDRDRVLTVLRDKEYAAQYSAKYRAQFDEIKEGAEHCNNVSQLRSYADKAEALKIRLLNEMDARDATLAAKRQAEQQPADTAGEEPPAPVKTRKVKNVSMKKVVGTSSWRLENREDVERCVGELRAALLAQMDGDDIVNIEF